MLFLRVSYIRLQGSENIITRHPLFPRQLFPADERPPNIPPTEKYEHSFQSIKNDIWVPLALTSHWDIALCCQWLLLLLCCTSTAVNSDMMTRYSSVESVNEAAPVTDKILLPHFHHSHTFCPSLFLTLSPYCNVKCFVLPWNNGTAGTRVQIGPGCFWLSFIFCLPHCHTSSCSRCDKMMFESPLNLGSP